MGSKFGCHPEDIYGCLYFYLSGQLQTFARRLRTTSVFFTAISTDARNLPDVTRERFDRIAVSNILDTNYVGIHGVLTLWGPLLVDSKNAAIVGYFMNWAMVQQNGRAFCSGEAGKKLLSTVIDKNKASSNEPNNHFQSSDRHFMQFNLKDAKPGLKNLSMLLFWLPGSLLIIIQHSECPAYGYFGNGRHGRGLRQFRALFGIPQETRSRCCPQKNQTQDAQKTLYCSSCILLISSQRCVY